MRRSSTCKMEKEVQNGPFPAAPKKRPSSYDERTIHFGRSTVETFRPGHIRQHFLFGQNHHYPHSYTPSPTLMCSHCSQALNLHRRCTESHVPPRQTDRQTAIRSGRQNCWVVCGKEKRTQFTAQRVSSSSQCAAILLLQLGSAQVGSRDKSDPIVKGGFVDRTQAM